MANLIFAWLVHLYTALGAVVGLYTILAIDESNFRLAFFLMAVTVIIDATDGALARAARVKEVIPWFDGALLDNLVDYLNYVIVPCLFLLRAGLLPPQDALWLAALPVLSSAYGFCQRDAKTADHFFLGFPSYWNIVCFLSVHAQNRALDKRFCDYRSVDLGIRANALHLSKPRASVSLSNQYFRRDLGRRNSLPHSPTA